MANSLVIFANVGTSILTNRRKALPEAAQSAWDDRLKELRENYGAKDLEEHGPRLTRPGPGAQRPRHAGSRRPR